VESKPQKDICNEPERYLKVAVSDEELSSMSDLGQTRQSIEAIRQDINSYGEDPLDVAQRAMREHRVLGLGEWHWSPNPFRVFGAEVMPRLREAGATHLALEIAATSQPLLAAFAASGDIDRFELPYMLRDVDYVNILKAARSQGMKLVAVDHPDIRDEHMVSSISTILDADPAAKVVFWVGGGHLKDGRGWGTAASLLRKSYSTCTIKGELAFLKVAPLLRMSRGLKRSLVVPTSKALRVGDLRDSLLDSRFRCAQYKYWDYVFIPRSKA
jgi:hypothetical protein